MVDISGQPELAAVHACGGKLQQNSKTASKRIVKVGGGGGKSGNFQCLIEAEKMEFFVVIDRNISRRILTEFSSL